MDWKDVGKAVKRFAPMLGTVIGGPIGGVAGGAVSLLCSAFGIEEEDAQDPAKVMAKIQMDPQWQVKLAEIESNNEIELQRLALQSDQAYLADRQSARTADVEKTKATGNRDTNLYVLAWVVVVGFFGLIGVLVFKQIPDSNEVAKVALPMLFGALIAGFKDVLGYFFGSSKSSSDKTKLLVAKGS